MRCRVNIRKIICLIYLIIPGCKSLGKHVEQSSIKSSSSRYSILIETSDNIDWQTTYKFEKPIKQVMFMPQPVEIRKNLFKFPIDLGVWKSETEFEFNQPVSQFSFSHITFGQNLLAGYEFHTILKNEGVLAFLGLYCVAVATGDNHENIYFENADITIINTKAKSIVAQNGLVNSNQLSLNINNYSVWPFVYFSEKLLTPSGNSYELIFNQDAPVDIKLEFEKKIKKFYNKLNESLYKNEKTNWIIFSLGKEMDDYDTAGGVIPDSPTPIAMLKADSQYFQNPEPTMDNPIAGNYYAAKYYMNRLVFHEIAHLWNVKSEQEWIWESLSEIIADVEFDETSDFPDALRSMFVPNELKEDFVACQDFIEKGKTGEVDTKQVSGMYYGCGHMFQLVLRDELNSQNKDIYDFWSPLFQNAIKNKTVVKLTDIKSALERGGYSKALRVYEIQIEQDLAEMYKYKNEMNAIILESLAKHGVATSGLDINPEGDSNSNSTAHSDSNPEPIAVKSKKACLWSFGENTPFLCYAYESSGEAVCSDDYEYIGENCPESGRLPGTCAQESLTYFFYENTLDNSPAEFCSQNLTGIWKNN